jgi:hypothetical protein
VTVKVCSSCKKEHAGKYKTCDRCLGVIRSWRNRNKEKVQASHQKYYQKNREQKIAYTIKWQKAQGEQYFVTKAEYCKKWYEKNREAHIQNCMQWHTSHREQVNKIARNWYKRHRNKAISESARWQRANPKKVSIYIKRRRARMKGVRTERITLDQIQRLKEQQKHLDFYTDEPLGKDFTWDHIISLSKGGPHCVDNIVLTKRETNSQKSTKSAKQFLAKLVADGKITSEAADRKIHYLIPHLEVIGGK